MRESEESKVKPKLWMVEEEANERFDEINLMSPEDLLECIKSNLEGLSLRNIGSHQEIILKMHEEILEK